MPLIEIKYFEQEFTDDERSGIVSAVTDAMVSFTGENWSPSVTRRANVLAASSIGRRLGESYPKQAVCSTCL